MVMVILNLYEVYCTWPPSQSIFFGMRQDMSWTNAMVIQIYMRVSVYTVYTYIMFICSTFPTEIYAFESKSFVADPSD